MKKSFMQGSTSQYKIYEQRYNRSRGNLLAVVVFTAINLILLVTNAGSYFLFSAIIPYYVAFSGMFICGRLPAEYYEDSAIISFADDSLFIVLLAISIVMTLVYLLAWIMSRRNRAGWLIFALVIFSIDTIGLLVLYGFSMMDIAFHALVIGYLISGIVACNKLKKLPPEEAMINIDNGSVTADESAEESTDPLAEELKTSPVLRRAEDVKHRVLLEARVLNYDVCYRRVKHTNELVINGNVYDELKGVIETTHVLNAWIEGHYIEAGNDGNYSFISLNGNLVERKRRLF